VPYINRDARTVLDTHPACKSGELNYLFTTAMLDYLRERGLSYQSINDCIGALEAAKLEFYRRVVVPYEIEKCFTNGDVYDAL